MSERISTKPISIFQQFTNCFTEGLNRMKNIYAVFIGHSQNILSDNWQNLKDKILYRQLTGVLVKTAINEAPIKTPLSLTFKSRKF